MISLNYRDSRPIYEQIRDGLRKLIVTGAMQPEEKLPSVRALAQPKTLSVAVTQTAKLRRISSAVAPPRGLLLHVKPLCQAIKR